MSPRRRRARAVREIGDLPDALTRMQGESSGRFPNGAED
jgi:hypothetical protein